MAPSQSPNHPSFHYIYLLQMNPRGAESSLATSRSPGFDPDTGVLQPSFSCLANTKLGPPPSTLRKAPRHAVQSLSWKYPTALGEMLCPAQRQQISIINTNHNKAMSTAAPSLDATQGALSHRKGLVGLFPQEYPELHLPGPAASHILHPQPFLQHLELNFSHQVHDQPHVPPSC